MCTGFELGWPGPILDLVRRSPSQLLRCVLALAPVARESRQQARGVRCPRPSVASAVFRNKDPTMYRKASFLACTDSSTNYLSRVVQLCWLSFLYSPRLPMMRCPRDPTLRVAPPSKAPPCALKGANSDENIWIAVTPKTALLRMRPPSPRNFNSF